MTTEPLENENLVVAYTDHDLDKYSLLEKVLAEARFFEALEEAHKKSGKPKADFKIVVKPNLAMMLRRGDVGTYTDPLLVIHLLRLLLQRGYANLAVVESQNLYGNWFRNRSVIQIAARAGYVDEAKLGTGAKSFREPIPVRGGGVDAAIPLIDLTYEMVKREVGAVGEIPVGQTWVEADYRINFTKMKSHFFSDYTLAIKNIYGCLPIQDKVRAYHCRRAVGKWTAALIQAYPVQFTLADAYTAADGWLGVKMKAIAVKTHTIMASRDLQALDHFGGKLMGVTPEKAIMFWNLMKLMPPRPYRVIGNAAPVKPWRRSPHLFARFCALIEGNANIMDFTGSLATGGHDDCFPPKRSSRRPFKKFLYALMLPINLISDIGFVHLRLREWIFVRRLVKQKTEFPLIAGSEFLLSRLMFFSPEDFDPLIRLIRLGVFDPVAMSGHYLIVAGREVPFPARLSLANFAALDVLRYLHARPADAEPLLRELAILQQRYSQLFPGNPRYAYCYK